MQFQLCYVKATAGDINGVTALFKVHFQPPSLILSSQRAAESAEVSVLHALCSQQSYWAEKGLYSCFRFYCLLWHDNENKVKKIGSPKVTWPSSKLPP